MEPPKIVCLCGSTRFKEAFELINMHETLKGHIVVTVGMFGHSDYPSGAKHICDDGNMDNARKQLLDRLHMRKIDLCDEVIVINVGGYIGQSTVNEIEYARSTGKPISMAFTHDPA